jgi:inosine-uridine nucleoside N-ribohydrolase/formylmethanofuran dehydrogenase subunit E
MRIPIALLVFFVALCGAIVALPACTTVSPGSAGEDDSNEMPAVVVDTDMGLDDVRALFALVTADGVELAAVATVEGSASAGRGTDNAIGLLESVHAEDVAVIAGRSRPDLRPPAWRETANALGGALFPPPREIEAKANLAGPLDELAARHGALHYLALGPLDNLARIADENPELMKRIHTIWIPCRLGGDGAVAGWNLDFDRDAATQVLESAQRVMLVDISLADGLNAREILSRMPGNAPATPAARWIARLLSSDADGNSHILLCDELAAAALIRPALLEMGDEDFRVEHAAKDAVSITPAAGGNIRTARIRDPEAAVALLMKLWQRPVRGHDGDEHVEKMSARDMIKTFHGHLGPYLVLGFRMGLASLEATGSEGHFDISAEIHTALQPPASCLLDGVQLGSGCTLGKRNIEVRAEDGPAWGIFRAGSGAEATIRLRAEIPGLVKRLIDEMGVEAAGNSLLEMENEALFEIEVSNRKSARR